MRYGKDAKTLVNQAESLVGGGAYPIDINSAFSAAHDVLTEYRRARTIHAPMRGSHEGYAVILEELEEMWDAIKANDITHAKQEAVQVAAMCLAFISEVRDGKVDNPKQLKEGGY